MRATTREKRASKGDMLALLCGVVLMELRSEAMDLTLAVEVIDKGFILGFDNCED